MKVIISVDTQKNETTAVLKTLQELYQKGVTWTKELDRTNSKKYALLAECLGTYHLIKGQNLERAVIKEITEELVNRGFVIKKNPKIINLIVRYVFNSDRRRVFSYARALNIAINDGIKVDQFAQWVADHGGIEDVTSKKGKTEEAIHREAYLKLKVEEARDLLVGKIATPLAVVAKDQFTDRAGGGEYTLLIGKTNGDNQTQVLCTVPDATSHMVDTAIGKIAHALMQDEKTKVAKKALKTRDKSDSASFKFYTTTDLAKLMPNQPNKSKAKAKNKKAFKAKKAAIAARHSSAAAVRRQLSLPV